MKRLVWVSLAAIFLLVLFPLVLGELMVGGLAKLHLSQPAAALSMFGIIFGGLINIPVKRIVHTEEIATHPLAIFGLADFWPELRRMRRETVIAVNVGGCLVPAGLACYELINLAVCYAIAFPVPQTGIMMPGLVPPFIAAMSALWLAPESAAPVAFIAGVTGPLVGADLLHLKDISKIVTGIASIGGAGTFDGIVLSGIVAAYLS